MKLYATKNLAEKGKDKLHISFVDYRWTVNIDHLERGAHKAEVAVKYDHAPYRYHSIEADRPRRGTAKNLCSMLKGPIYGYDLACVLLSVDTEKSTCLVLYICTVVETASGHYSEECTIPFIREMNVYLWVHSLRKSASWSYCASDLAEFCRDLKDRLHTGDPSGSEELERMIWDAKIEVQAMNLTKWVNIDKIEGTDAALLFNDEDTLEEADNLLFLNNYDTQRTIIKDRNLNKWVVDIDALEPRPFTESEFWTFPARLDMLNELHETYVSLGEQQVIFGLYEQVQLVKQFFHYDTQQAWNFIEGNFDYTTQGVMSTTVSAIVITAKQFIELNRATDGNFAYFLAAYNHITVYIVDIDTSGTVRIAMQLDDFIQNLEEFLDSLYIMRESSSNKDKGIHDSTHYKQLLNTQTDLSYLEDFKFQRNSLHFELMLGGINADDFMLNIIKEVIVTAEFNNKRLDLYLQAEVHDALQHETDGKFIGSISIADRDHIKGELSNIQKTFTEAREVLNQLEETL